MSCNVWNQFYKVSFPASFFTFFYIISTFMLSNVRLIRTFIIIGSSLSIPQNANWILMNMSYLIGFPKTSRYLKTPSSNNLLSVYCHYQSLTYWKRFSNNFKSPSWPNFIWGILLPACPTFYDRRKYVPFIIYGHNPHHFPSKNSLLCPYPYLWQCSLVCYSG